MFNSTSRHSPRMGMVTFVLILTTLLTSCGGTAPKQPTPTPARSFSPTAYPCGHASPRTGLIRLSGVGYSPYHAGQSPDVGTFPSSAEVQADMATLKTLTNYIRIYSSTGPANEIIQAAEANGMQVALGIWLGAVPQANNVEIAAGEQLASSNSQAVRAVIVGNEALLRGDLTEDQLRSYLQQVRAKLGHTVPITMADSFDQWLAHPALANDVDFITVHIYPFWGGVSIDCAIQALDKAYKQVKAAFPGKQIVIGETGWPSDISAQPEMLPGSALCASQAGASPTPTSSPSQPTVAPSPTASPSQGGAVPSSANEALYLNDFTTWAQQNGVQYFYFDAFDESWKIHEKGVGTHWGLYQEDGQLKPALSGLLPPADPATVTQRSYLDVAVGGLEPGFDLGIDTSQHVYGWLTVKGGVFTLAYPAGQQWGTMFITVCKPVPPAQRHFSRDLSAYHTLAFDMRATAGQPCIKVGIKDWKQPDDGSEQKVDECLTTQWVTYTRPLSVFSDADLTHLYVVFEVVFAGASSLTVQVRNVRYSPT